MTTCINHDGFARQETVRAKIKWHGAPASCDWCGSRPARFEYGILSDGRLSGQVDWIAGRFCCIDCMRSYHS